MLFPIALAACLGCSAADAETEEREVSERLNPAIEVFAAYQSMQSSNLKLAADSIGTFSRSALGQQRFTADLLGAHAALHIFPWLYVGPEGAIGLGSVANRPLRANPPVTMDGPMSYVQLGAIVGFESPRLGPIDVRAELFAGGQTYGSSVQEQRYGCVEHDGQQACDGLSGAMWLLKPKVAAEVWVGANITLGLSASTDVLHAGDWTAAAFISFHPFAQEPSSM